MSQSWYTHFLNILFPPRHGGRGWQEISSSELQTHIRLRAVPNIPDTYALFPYREPVIRELVWSLKYHNARGVADLFGETASVLAPLTRNELVLFVPIPLSSKRYRERGYNQAHLLAQALTRNLTNTEVRDALIRTKDNEHQAHLKKDERERNVRGVFAVHEPEKIKDATVFLLDDVITTGATMREARQTLLRAGARNVICIAITH